MLELLTSSFIFKSKLGPLIKRGGEGCITLGVNSILKDITSAVCNTTHKVSFKEIWDGRGSYNFTMIVYCSSLLSSKAILVAILKILLPKFK